MDTMISVYHDAESSRRRNISLYEQLRCFDFANLLTYESIDQSACDGVDEDLHKAKCPYGFDVIRRSVHLSHEAVLAHGKGICEDDVRGRQEGGVECHIRRWPEGPANSRQQG